MKTLSSLVLAAFLSTGASQAATYNLEFDVDGNASNVDGTGTITIDDTLIPAGGGKVLVTQPGVNALIDLGGFTFDTLTDVGVNSNDTFFLLDAFGMIVGTDDETGNFLDVLASGQGSGGLDVTINFQDSDFGSFIFGELDPNDPGNSYSLLGSGTFDISREPSVVPLPAGAVLFLSALTGLAALRRSPTVA